MSESTPCLASRPLAEVMGAIDDIATAYKARAKAIADTMQNSEFNLNSERDEFLVEARKYIKWVDGKQTTISPCEREIYLGALKAIEEATFMLNSARTAMETCVRLTEIASQKAHVAAVLARGLEKEFDENSKSV